MIDFIPTPRKTEWVSVVEVYCCLCNNFEKHQREGREGWPKRLDNGCRNRYDEHHSDIKCRHKQERNVHGNVTVTADGTFPQDITGYTNGTRSQDIQPVKPEKQWSEQKTWQISTCVIWYVQFLEKIEASTSNCRASCIIFIILTQRNSYNIV